MVAALEAQAQAAAAELESALAERCVCATRTRHLFCLLVSESCTCLQAVADCDCGCAGGSCRGTSRASAPQLPMLRAMLPQQSQLPRASQSVSAVFVGRSGAALRSRAVRKEARASVGAAQLRADSCGWLAIEDEFGEVYYFHGRTVRTQSPLLSFSLPSYSKGS